VIDLVTWLRTQLDEDASRAHNLDGRRAPSPWQAKGDGYGAYVEAADGTIIEERGGGMYMAVATHIAHWDPARVLAEVDAKRRILDEIVPEANGLDSSVDLDRRIGIRDQTVEPYCSDQLVRLLALPYADRPGYRDEWRPGTAT